MKCSLIWPIYNLYSSLSIPCLITITYNEIFSSFGFLILFLSSACVIFPNSSNADHLSANPSTAISNFLSPFLCSFSQNRPSCWRFSLPQKRLVSKFFLLNDIFFSFVDFFFLVWTHFASQFLKLYIQRRIWVLSGFLPLRENCLWIWDLDRDSATVRSFRGELSFLSACRSFFLGLKKYIIQELRK